MQRQVRWLSVAAAVIAVAAGCQKQEGTKSEGTAPAGREYRFNASVPGKVTVGGTGELVAEVSAGEGFKLNAEYPVNFRPDKNSAGIQFDQPKYDLTGAEKTACEHSAKDHCAFKAKIPFSAQAAGNEKVAGTLAFSVCNPDRCLIEKVPVEVPVQVH